MRAAVKLRSCYSNYQRQLWWPASSWKALALDNYVFKLLLNSFTVTLKVTYLRWKYITQCLQLLESMSFDSVIYLSCLLLKLTSYLNHIPNDTKTFVLLSKTYFFIHNRASYGSFWSYNSHLKHTLKVHSIACWKTIISIKLIQQ